MEKLPMCRICLAENVRMYVVVNRNLHKLYEKLTDIPFVTKDYRPILACFFCCAKLKKCYRLLRQCLEAEELFAQRLYEDCEPNQYINQDHVELCSGFIKTPIEHISIDDECQTESIAIKEELPAVYEGLHDVIVLKEERESDELDMDNSSLDVADHSESDLEDKSLKRFNTEAKDEGVSKNKRRDSETTKIGKSRAEYMRNYRQKKREEKLKIGKLEPKIIARSSTQRSRDFRARAVNLVPSQTSTADPTISLPNLVDSHATLRLPSLPISHTPCISKTTACNIDPAEIQPRPADVEQKIIIREGVEQEEDQYHGYRKFGTAHDEFRIKFF